ncbi:MAG: adenylate/guanylate cyclase domain-containing protein [Cyanobacteriota bacterium]|nr:adenylate/guanylate cyclase domain-containing protein [Cyanobacteriota bacterium]
MMLSESPCVVCGTVNAIDHNFCSHCGTALRTSPCPACGAPNAAGQVVCESCGAFLRGRGDQALFDRRDERKFVTALFADIKGSVALLSERDIEEGRRILDAVILHISSLIKRYEGTVIDTVGDGVFALFGAPRSLDGHPRAAVNAALEIQDSMRDPNGPEPLLADIQLRIGIDSGDVIWRVLQVGREMRHLPIGPTVNQASRLQEIAEPGSVLIGEATHELVKDYFGFAPFKDLVLKGIPGTVKGYKVLKASEVFRNLQVSMKRGLSPFVGREKELHILSETISAFERGSGKAMILVSEAGGGKSRLLYEVTKTLENKFTILEAFCISHMQSSPWYSVVQLIRSLLGITSGLSSQEAKQVIKTKLSLLDSGLLDDLPTLFQFLDLDPGLIVPANADPTVRKRKYISLILRLLALQAAKQPLVVIFEDLHWLDQQSVAVVDAIWSITQDHPILLLCTSRPEGLTPSWRSDQGSVLQLSHLDLQAARELMVSLVPGKAISDALVNEIQSKTQGNPFFIEEIICSPQFSHSFLLNQQSPLMDPMVMPSTIKMAISDRIDRLTIREKNYLQMLAVVGIRCRISLLARLIAEEESDVRAVLADLENLGFVVKPNQDEDAHVRFGHVLIQEVAYSSLLKDQRATLHEHIGDTIQSEYAEGTSELLPQLAHHYHHSRNDGKAVEHLRLAGESAIQRSAHQEAQNYLKLCLKRLEKSRKLEAKINYLAQLWLSLGVSLQVTLGYAAEEVRTAYENAVEFSEQAEESEHLLAALRGYGIFNIVKANYSEAAKIADRLKHHAKGDSAFALEHLILSGLSYSYRGELEKGAKSYQKGLDITTSPASATTIQYSGYSPGICYSYYALNALFSGRLRLAMSHAQRGLDVALESGIPVAVAQSRGMLGHVLFCLSEFDLADEQHQINMAFADDNGFAYWSLLSRILTSWTTGFLRNESSALDELQAYISAYRGSGALIGVPWFLNLSAELLWRFGRTREALVLLGEAEGIASLTQERFFLVDTLRLKGDLHAELSPEPVSLVAMQCYREALNLARVQGSWFPGMRAALPLARLLHRQGDLEAAQAVIKEHYSRLSWIPCPDQEQAHALMDTLSMDCPGIR